MSLKDFSEKKRHRITQRRIVDDFNARFAVGTTVMLRKDTEMIETTVRAPAQVLEGRTAVGWFTGVSGCYAIEDRVTPISNRPAA